MITLNLARGDNYESVPLRLPTTPGEVDEVFAALDAASRYAGEVQIIGVDSGVPSLAKHLKGAGLTDPDAFDKLNRLAEKIDGMDERQRDIFSGALDAESAGSLDDVLRVSDSLEAYTFVPNVRSDEELGRYVVVAEMCIRDRPCFPIPQSFRMIRSPSMCSTVARASTRMPIRRRTRPPSRMAFSMATPTPATSPPALETSSSRLRMACPLERISSTRRTTSSPSRYFLETRRV